MPCTIIFLVRPVNKFIRSLGGDLPKVDHVVEARVVEEPAPVQVTEDTDVVGAVAQELVPLMLLRELDGLEPTPGLDLHLVVLAEEVQSEGGKRRARLCRRKWRKRALRRGCRERGKCRCRGARECSRAPEVCASAMRLQQFITKVYITVDH
jgi:hypothetical protein